MKTLDIKIKHSKDIKKASADFSDNEAVNTLGSDSSEKADSEFPIL